MLNFSGDDALKRVRESAMGIMLPLLIGAFAGNTPLFSQINYYVASNGNDGNSGTTASSPFQTLAKVRDLPLQPGDSVLFRRGDTFRGTLTIQRSGSSARGITYGAYGTGLKPVIAGSEPLGNWSSAGTNLWQASCASCGDAVTGLYKSGVSQPLGRYPNADAANRGNLTIRAHTEKYQIFSQEHLPDGIDWKGAEVVMRPAAWILDRAVVDAQYGDALNLFNYSNYTPRDNSEFFFQNHPATLDRNGEWYYDKGNRRFLIYSDQGQPTNGIYTATVYGRGVSINSGNSNISLTNLRITETLNTAIYGENNSNLVIRNLDMVNQGEDGIIINGGGNTVLIENSQLIDVNNNAVSIGNYQNVTLRGNNIRRIGVIPGRGKSGDGQYNGIHLSADQNVLVEENTLNGIGYNGIDFSSNTTIRRNVIANCCVSKVDGGGVYSHNGSKGPMSNINILSNIFYTDANGLSPWFDYSIGIFLDDCVENVTIQDNTVFGHTQWGVFLHAANHVTFRNNTVFDNKTCQFVVYHNSGSCPIRGDIIKQNIFVSKTNTQLIAQYESNANDLQQYGTIDSNYYARPFNEDGAIRGIYNGGTGGNYALRDWKIFSGGHDLHSTASPITYQEYKAEGAGGETKVYSTFDQNINGWELAYSRYGNAAIAYDSTNKLDGGSIRFSFPTLSGQPGSFAQMTRPFGALKKNKIYVLRFDAVSSTNVTLLVHLRIYGAPYTEYGRRYYLTLTPDRQSYELAFSVLDDEPNAIIMMQTDMEGPVIWVDNVRFQEGPSIGNNPDDFIKLYYNPTLRDSTVALPGGNYIDVKSQAYSGSVVLKPFTSIILFKQYPVVSNADLSLAIETDKRFVSVNETATYRVRVRNEGGTTAALARWTFRLPAYSEFVIPPGQSYSDNVLTGTVSSLPPYTDTTFTFRMRPTAEGLFRTSAQLTTATSPDPDSTPNSGLFDGEDDAATTEIVSGRSNAVYTSPNPNLRALPSVQSSQPAPDPNKADLSLLMTTSRQSVGVGEVLIVTIQVQNAGGRDATNVQVLNKLPNGVDVVDATGWSSGGGALSRTITSVPANSTVSVSFQIQINQAGMAVNQAQIQASDVPDPDSTPGNGYALGEDDEAQVVVRGL